MVLLTLEKRLSVFSEIVKSAKITDLSGRSIDLELGLAKIYDFLTELKHINGTLYIIGNGGSAGVASHATTDFFNVAKIKTFVLHESSLLTCLSNDYGYENSFSRSINQVINKKDILIAISSSGKSQNIINAANAAIEKEAKVITFTGFESDNPLGKIGQYNINLSSNDYGFVEVGHQFILHNLADRFNKNITY